MDGCSSRIIVRSGEELPAALYVVMQQFGEVGEMEPAINQTQRDSETERPKPPQPSSEPRPDTSLPFATEGLEQVRDSHC